MWALDAWDTGIRGYGAISGMVEGLHRYQFGTTTTIKVSNRKTEKVSESGCCVQENHPAPKSFIQQVVLGVACCRLSLLYNSAGEVNV